MTAQTDLDGKLRAWLDLMPDEAPDRAIAAVLQAIDTTPQPRRARRWPTWRSTPMNRSLAALGAAAVIVVAGTLLVLRPGSQPSVGSTGSPPPSAQASPSASSPAASPSAIAGTPVSADLAGRWMGGSNSFVGSGQGSSMVIGTDELDIEHANLNGQPVLRASASSLGAGQLRLDTVGGPGCSAGDVGVYAWTRSASGRILTIRTVSDACAARGAAVAGTWWQMSCRNPQTDCVGDLDAGTYASQYITPRLDVSWYPEFAGLTYTVPDGWANSQDWPNTFTLTPSSSYVKENASGPPDGVRHEIYLFTEPAATVQDGACDNQPDAAVGRTPAGLATWLTRQPSLTTTTPVPITIGGRPGTMLDLTLRASWSKSCPGDSTPEVALLGPSGTPINGWGFGIARGERVRLVLLDLGGGHVTGIAIDDWPAVGAPSGFQALVDAAMPVIQSFRFQ